MRNFVTIAAIAIALAACKPQEPTYRLVAYDNGHEYIYARGLTLRDCRTSPLAEEFLTKCEPEG